MRLPENAEQSKSNPTQWEDKLAKELRSLDWVLEEKPKVQVLQTKQRTCFQKGEQDDIFVFCHFEISG